MMEVDQSLLVQDIFRIHMTWSRSGGGAPYRPGQALCSSFSTTFVASGWWQQVAEPGEDRQWHDWLMAQSDGRP